MKTICLRNLLFGLLAGILGALPLTSYAADTSRHQVVGGVAIYLGIFPAELIQGHPKQHPEGEMHGGVPAGGHRYHITVALFDNASGKRISGAKVSAQVHEINLAGTQKKLEPMLIAGTVSYGNYFNMPATHNPYRIRVLIERPGVAGVIEAQFDYQHARA